METGYDYPDRLSPFLVKELRQGLRSNSYLLIAGALLIALTTHSLIMIVTPETRPGAAILLRVMLHAGLCILMPLNALGAVFEERRGGRIELLRLTPLTARGLLYGKWLVHGLRSTLMASLVPPFILLGYFTGGMNAVDELLFLLWCLLLGLGLSAVTLFVSGLMSESLPFANLALRVGAGLLVLFTGNISSLIAYGLIHGSTTGIAGVGAVVLVGGGMITFFIIELAAMTLGSSFENSGRAYGAARPGTTPPPLSSR